MKISRKKSHMLLVVVVAGIFAAASACAWRCLGVFIYRTAASDQSQQDLSYASEYLQTELKAAAMQSDLRIATLSGQISACTGYFGAKKGGSGTLDLCEDGVSAFGVGEIGETRFLQKDGKDHAASVDGSAELPGRIF